MAEAKTVISSSLRHKNTEGQDCSCAAAADHHRDSLGKDCACLIGRDHHKDAKNEDCACKVGINHNTKPQPHRDKEGRPCSGPCASNSATLGKRVCGFCRREETYHPTELIIVFKKGITASEAENFVYAFRIDGQALTIKNKSKDIVEKNGAVAIAASRPPASKRSAEEWLREIEKFALIRFASQVMVVVFKEFTTEAENVSDAERGSKNKKTQKDDPDDFPDEMNV